MASIRFGTSGWRGVISDEFTFANVRRVAAAAAGHAADHAEYGSHGTEFLASLGTDKRRPMPLVVIGYDTRFLSEEFARETAAVLAAAGVQVHLSPTDVPTPCVAHAILDRQAVGGVTITASHNPWPYNGFKWNPFWAGPATPAVTDDLERRTAAVPPAGPAAARYEDAVADGRIKVEDFLPAYRKALLGLLDRSLLKRAKLRVGVDCLHGTSRQVLPGLLRELGCEVIALHEDRDVLFGGKHPEPSEENLTELQAVFQKKRPDLALACDCDADRFGILDPEAGFLEPNEFLGLALYHLAEHRGQRGKIARSLMTSHFVDAVGRSYGMEMRETPVGFKYIGDLMRTGDYLIGGEESGGMTIRGHVPEKDGILADLLAAELVGAEEKTIGQLRTRLWNEIGPYLTRRVDLRLTPEQQKRLARHREDPPGSVAGRKVERVSRLDGIKLIFQDGSWILVRESGTEPVARLYIEAHSPSDLEALTRAGRELIA